MKRILKLAVYGIAAIAAFSSCSNENDFPSQQEIETKIVGKWKMIKLEGKELVTNEREVRTFNADGLSTISMSKYVAELHTWVWSNQESRTYTIAGNQIHEKNNEGLDFSESVNSIDDNKLVFTQYTIISPEGELNLNGVQEYTRVTADFSEDIIGLWEGVEVTGEETYGGADARIEYGTDGAYTYYVEVGDNWVASENVGNEYNVDGDWLAHRWRPTADSDYEYEWWNIESISNGQMKWTALRKKEDGTRFHTTFIWRKVKN